MILKITNDIRGIVDRSKGDVVEYKPWNYEWQGMGEKERVLNGIFVHCYGHGEFEVFRLGVNVEL